MLLDGKKLNMEIASHLEKTIQSLGEKPKLCIIQIGNDPASTVYVSMKVKYSDSIGAITEVIKFEEGVAEDEVIQKIEDLNEDNTVNGIIVQLPIPKNLDTRKIINTISCTKDVDGLSDTNLAKLVSNEEGLRPATAKGVIKLLDANNIDISGKYVVVVGRSVLVGKSCSLSFINRDATVTVCHSKTNNLAKFVNQADILVLAAGSPGLVTKDMIRSDQVVVDVAISVVDGSVLGDASNISEEDVMAISPVPGGVGPMTVASLFENLLDAYHLQQ